MNILIAVDGSPPSLEAVRLAGRLVSADQDEIVLYYSPPGLELVQTVAGATVLRGREALAQSVFAEAKARLPVNWSPAVQTVIGASDPSEGILHAARDRKSDLIVVGARGMGRLERLLLGSVSRAVVHAAEVPVLVVRDAEKAAASSDFRILVAFEGETSGRQLAAVLGRFTWPAGTSAVSLHVVESVFGGKIPEWLDAQARRARGRGPRETVGEGSRPAARRQCPASPTGLPGASRAAAGCRALRARRRGRARDRRTGAEQRSDLIVIGAKGSTRLGRLLLGGTAESVLNHAPCSVLLVRHGGPAGRA